MFKGLKQRWYNFILCIKYPIIIPRTMIKDRMCTNFFSHTWLDHFPEGWKNLGLNFFKELQEVLNKSPKDERKSFRIYDIKEKFGSLRIHLSWFTDAIEQVVNKYEKLSAKTCIYCGRKARWKTVGWVEPLCNHCRKEYTHKYKVEPLYRKHKRKRYDKKRFSKIK